MRVLTILLLGYAAANAVQAQVVITSDDLFNKVGQYYRAYANKSDVALTGQLGKPGGNQTWNFTLGPMDDTYRFDIISPSDGGHNADFPKAKVAERKTEELNGLQSYLFFEQVPGIGRTVYGFYDEEFSQTTPAHVFSSSIVDFPDTIRYGDTWGTSTTFDTEMTFDTGIDPEDPEGGGEFAFPIKINYTSSATVDAWGIVILPGKLSFGDALRVNELVTYEFQMDLEGTGNFMTVATQYTRNYYWLREDMGIAVQITSKDGTTPPPDNFTVASQFIRMYESNHPVGLSTPEGIRDFQVSLGKDSAGRPRALLSWVLLGSVASYRVEYTDDPAKGNWTVLGTTTANFMVDTSLPGVTARFYRLTGLRN